LEMLNSEIQKPTVAQKRETGSAHKPAAGKRETANRSDPKRRKD